MGGEYQPRCRLSGRFLSSKGDDSRMSWMGKIIGGGLGMALGGPLGAIIGARLGHTFVDSKPGGVGGARLSTGETKQMVFFTTAFAMLGKMAKADGRVTQDEIQVVEQFIKPKYRGLIVIEQQPEVLVDGLMKHKMPADETFG